MKKHIGPFAAFIAVTFAALACSSSVEVVGTGLPSSDQAATVVAATLQAITPEVSETPASLLPQSLYFLGNDDQGITQVFRIERDGKTKTQLTFESVKVDDYDVSPVDGKIAFVVNNQLLSVNADGSDRRVLTDGGSPVFSPDGRTLAYGHEGLNLYDVSSGVSNLVIQDQLGDPFPNGGRFPIELYWPERYSPDGTKLLLALGHWEVAPSHAVYDLKTNTLVKYAEVQDYIYCCSFHGGPVWSPDGSSFYGVASVHDTAYRFGELWRVDAANGALTRIFDSPLAGSETVYLPVEPYPAPDGQLYFFFGTYDVNSGFFDAPVLNLVRSASDGVTDRTVLRNENFRLMNEALWAPDASFVITATWPGLNWDRNGGVLELYYTDGQKDMVSLAPFGQEMKWGP